MTNLNLNTNGRNGRRQDDVGFRRLTIGESIPNQHNPVLQQLQQQQQGRPPVSPDVAVDGYTRNLEILMEGGSRRFVASVTLATGDVKKLIRLMKDPTRREDIIEGFTNSRYANETILLPFAWVAKKIDVGNLSDQEEDDMDVLLDNLVEFLQLLTGHSKEVMVLIMRQILLKPDIFDTRVMKEGQLREIKEGQDSLLAITKFSLQMTARLETVLVEEGTVFEVSVRESTLRISIDKLFNGSFKFALKLVKKLTVDGRVALKLNDPTNDQHAPPDMHYAREMGNADKFLRDCFTRYWKRSSLNRQLPGAHNNAEANQREMYHEVTKLVMNIQHALTESGPDNSLTLEE